MKPDIGITIGDPAGIGPEVVMKTMKLPEIKRIARFHIYGDKNVFLRLTGSKSTKSWPSNVKLHQVGNNIPLKKIIYGKPDGLLGKASGDFINAAVQDAQIGIVQAIVTAPINKVSFKMGGWGNRFVGHTEMLAKLSNTKSFALMMIHGKVRAIHVTSHIALKDVPKALTTQRVLETIVLANQGLKMIGINRPKIAVCGLNPHAGDNGIMGQEETRVIKPAVRLAVRERLNVEGPLSADVVWPFVAADIYDLGVAMYHDQGQIPIKLNGFQLTKNRTLQVGGVNVTVGLPFIRTSVAHGSAYEIAGKNQASPQSMRDAILLAMKMLRMAPR